MTVSASSVSYTALTAPGGWPLLGHLPRIVRDPLGFVGRLSAYGDIVDVKVGPVRMSVVCHPELVDRMLRNEWSFDKGGPFFDRARDIVGNGLVTCPRAEHRRQRRLLQPAFHPSRLPGYAEVMAERVVEEITGWRDGQNIDVLRVMTQMTSQVLARCLFSRAEPDTTIALFLDTVEELLSLGPARMLTPSWLDWAPLPGKRRYDRACARVREISARVITERRRTATDHGDLLSALLAARDEDGTALSESELLDQITLFYIGGSETSADTLGWIFYLLSEHPEVEQRLHAELDAVLGGRSATYEDLSQLTYTRQITDEALRLYPPAWMFTRTTTTDTELGGHVIPAGRTVAYSAYAVNRHPGVHRNPDEFDPDRWQGDRMPATAYIPFGAGARRCIGDTFGLVEITLLLATIAARWRLVSVPECSFTPRAGVTLAPYGLQLRLEERA